ncbi:MAG TPA: aminotransferase class I/II-fold pyridoxal phosphate-dependent enzyme [Actinophytocola sp.]|uniref:trans-sulfuration enzyme family protein n=1 Tax=Actinophytocola sp. TaxID=1872138 RepID=UPI002DBD0E92|nr:aminotransferase class I/II-fold pyridoxal phosphate-dependent enzyme [Actinophytocola sp.]HEU5472345.1 aminotransferase class I/II-fold pyridoxal phosphate-dependent enzyme [Actinophytocola sp.]
MVHPSDDARIDTIAVHGGERRPGPEGSLVFPIYQGTVYTVEPGTGYHDMKYIRLNSTPSQAYLHEKLATLEGAEAALATASGMAAITTTLLTLLRPGDHALVSDCLYGGTHDFLTQKAAELGWSYTFVDPRRPETWAAARRPETRLFLVETITNPMIRVARLRDVVTFARQEGLTTVIDNTFASPVNFRPLSIGFDLVMHSATKYLNGHSDLVAGCVAGSAELVDRVRHTLNLYGGSLDPHAGFLLARGLKTLAVRVRAQNHNALTLARFLAEHPKVAEVHYPGLPTHPDHEHAARLLSGFGGMASFRLTGGVAAAEALFEALRIPYVAPSLGGVESLITRPAATSHAGMSAADRERIGITDDLIRLSIGIEDPADLTDDFDAALGKV